LYEPQRRGDAEKEIRVTVGMMFNCLLLVAISNACKRSASASRIHSLARMAIAVLTSIYKILCVSAPLRLNNISLCVLGAFAVKSTT